MTSMRIDLYTISWNERRMLPFFLDYYGAWVDRIVVFDDASDDGTAEALARHPKVDLRPFPPKGDSFVLAASRSGNTRGRRAAGAPTGWSSRTSTSSSTTPRACAPISSAAARRGSR